MDPYLAWLEEAELSALHLYPLARAPDDVSTRRGAGSYVDRLFKGAKPPQLPVEQVDQFQLMINQNPRAIGFASWLESLAPPHTVFVANDYDEVFARIAAENFDGAYVPSDPLNNQPGNIARIGQLSTGCQLWANSLERGARGRVHR
jgi:hypothetical protein